MVPDLLVFLPQLFVDLRRHRRELLEIGLEVAQRLPVVVELIGEQPRSRRSIAWTGSSSSSRLVMSRACGNDRKWT